MFGAAYGIISDPSLLDALRAVRIELRVPTLALGALTPHDFLLGIVFLALPQIPLTLGNAIVAITEENNRLFPDRIVNESRIATSTGLMNVLSASVGGIPMCHGAGGMAGHVQFGAWTGVRLSFSESPCSSQRFYSADRDIFSPISRSHPRRYSIPDRGSTGAGC